MGATADDERLRNQAWPDRQIAAIAGRQATNVGYAQLRELGIRPSTITAALSRGRLHPVHVGVYSLVPAVARPPLAAEHAAILACGPSALLSHETAAWLHGLRDTPPRPAVHLTVVGGSRGRTRRGLRAHRSATLIAAERAKVGPLAVTSVARTVIDLAAGQSDDVVERLVIRALRKTSRTKLAEALERHPGRRGVVAVRRSLDPGLLSSDTWSKAEARLLSLMRQGGVPQPEANVPIGPYVPDLLWREYNVIVEYQSDQEHSGEGARYADSDRHNDLTSWGYSVLHVTRPELYLHPVQVLVWVVAALTRNGWYGRR